MPSGKDLVGVCQWRITLRAGKTWAVQLATGVQPNGTRRRTASRSATSSSRKPTTAAWTRTRQTLAGPVRAIRVETPDDDINRMVNLWNKYQLMVNFYFGRGPSYYHKGQYPAMRDCCQDAFGVIPLQSGAGQGRTSSRIARFFFTDGRRLRRLQPRRPARKARPSRWTCRCGSCWPWRITSAKPAIWHSWTKSFR